ncbi:hypothetical protein ACH4KU_21675 [Streptomyces althioticus]
MSGTPLPVAEPADLRRAARKLTATDPVALHTGQNAPEETAR